MKYYHTVCLLPYTSNTVRKNDVIISPFISFITGIFLPYYAPKEKINRFFSFLFIKIIHFFASDLLNIASNLLKKAGDLLNIASDLLKKAGDLLNIASDLLKKAGNLLKKAALFWAKKPPFPKNYIPKNNNKLI